MLAKLLLRVQKPEASSLVCKTNAFHTSIVKMHSVLPSLT